jgi:hypothetical protein
MRKEGRRWLGVEDGGARLAAGPPSTASAIAKAEQLDSKPAVCGFCCVLLAACADEARAWAQQARAVGQLLSPAGSAECGEAFRIARSRQVLSPGSAAACRRLAELTRVGGCVRQLLWPAGASSGPDRLQVMLHDVPRHNHLISLGSDG